MADKTKSVSLEITAKDKASAALKNVGKEISTVNEKSKELNKTNEGFTSGLGSSVAKIGALAAGFLSFNKVLSYSIALAKESTALYGVQVKAEAQLTSALGYRSQALIDNASALQSVTTFGDEAILSSQSLAAAFIKDEQELKRVSAAAADLASAKGMSLMTATDLITKSVQSGTNALKEHGISMDTTSDKSKRLDSLLKGINKSFGGMAEALANTDIGRIDQLNNSIGDIKESIGEELMPAYEDLTRFNHVFLNTIDKTLKSTRHIDTWLKSAFKGESLLATVFEDLSQEARGIGGDEGIDLLGKVLKEINAELIGYNAKYDEAAKKHDDAVNSGSKREIKATQKKMDVYKEYVDQYTKGVALLMETQDALATQSMLQGTRIGGRGPIPDDEEETKKKLERENKLQKQVRDLAVAWAEADAQARYEAKQRGLENEFEMYSDYSTRSIAIDQQNLINKEALRKSFEERTRDLSLKTLDGRTDDIAKQFSDELTKYKFMLDQKIITDQEYEQMSATLRKDYRDQEIGAVTEHWSEMSNTITGIASTMMQSVQMINDINTKKELKDLDDITESRKKSATKNIANRKLLDAELEKIDKDAERRREEIAKSEKKIAMIMAIINTAQGVTAALAASAPPTNFIMAGLVGLAGAIQVGMIASQAFAQGGIVQPQAGVSTTGDNTMVRVNPGEMILNQRQQSNLLAMASTRAGGGINIQETIVVQGNMDSSAIEELKRHRESWLDMLRESNKELRYRGYTYAT